jgi:hypothetical protein
MRTIGPHGNPSYWTPERLERLRQYDETAWRINALGEFIDPEHGLLSPVSIAQSTRTVPGDLPRNPKFSYSAAVDPSEAGANGNAFTLTIVEREGLGEAAKFRVALVREFRSGGPAQIWSEINNHCKRYGVRAVVSDQWGGEAQREIARQAGLDLRKRTTTAKSKLEDFQNLATLLHAGKLELANDKQLLDDLRSVRLVTTQSGQSIHLPRTGDGRHCDYAPALAAAIRGAFHGGRFDTWTAQHQAEMQRYVSSIGSGRWGSPQYVNPQMSEADVLMMKGVQYGIERWGRAHVEAIMTQYPNIDWQRFGA